MTKNFNYDDFNTEESADNILARIAKTAIEQKQAELEVEEAEEVLKKAQEKLRNISWFVFPALMEEAGQKQLITKDGISVTVNEDIRASIPAKFQKQAFKWLNDNGYDRLIKKQFVIEFNKEQEEWAKQFEVELSQREDPLMYDKKESVHASTLKSFVKGQLEEGVNLPLDIFGVFKQRITKIKA